MKDFKKIIGKRIAKERKIKKISQEQLAELVGIHRTFVGKIERGEKNITLEKVQKIFEALDLEFKICNKKPPSV